MAKRWYVVHTYSQFEKSVQRALAERIARGGMQGLFGEILVPVEEVVELKSGQKSISERIKAATNPLVAKAFADAQPKDFDTAVETYVQLFASLSAKTKAVKRPQISRRSLEPPPK